MKGWMWCGVCIHDLMTCIIQNGNGHPDMPMHDHCQWMSQGQGGSLYTVVTICPGL